jgi:hypothetical protein
MSRNNSQSLNRQAEKLQKNIDAEIVRRAELLKEAAAAADFQTKARIHKMIRWSEEQIEAWNRAIRRMHTKANEQKQPCLWDFPAQADAPPPRKRKGAA